MKDAICSEGLEIKVELDLLDDKVFAEEVNLIGRHLGEVMRIALQEINEE